MLKKLSNQLRPKSLFSRSVLILLIPLLLIQVVLGYLFFDRHTDAILRTISETISGEIALVIECFEKKTADLNSITRMAHNNLSLTVAFTPNLKLKETGRYRHSFLYTHLGDALEKKIKHPYYLRMDFDFVYVSVELKNGILKFETARKRLFSRTTPRVLIWTAASALLLFLVALIFMRNQIRPLKRLSYAAEQFGKGDKRHVVKLEGALEIRRLAQAFNDMSARLSRHLLDRTEMLAGVSHDFKTILTRFKLQGALLNPSIREQFESDICDMQSMLDGFLTYAQGTQSEDLCNVNLADLLEDIAEALSHNSGENTPKIHILCDFSLIVRLKPLTINRLVTNLLLNGVRYAKEVWVRGEFVTSTQGKFIRLIIDDNGPGIPESEREAVFRPFYRLDTARNLNQAGSGLGLSIVRDGIRAHGGSIRLSSSSQGGLRVVIRIPQ